MRERDKWKNCILKTGIDDEHGLVLTADETIDGFLCIILDKSGIEEGKDSFRYKPPAGHRIRKYKGEWRLYDTHNGEYTSLHESLLLRDVLKQFVKTQNAVSRESFERAISLLKGRLPDFIEIEANISENFAGISVKDMRDDEVVFISSEIDVVGCDDNYEIWLISYRSFLSSDCCYKSLEEAVSEYLEREAESTN